MPGWGVRVTFDDSYIQAEIVYFSLQSKRMLTCEILIAASLYNNSNLEDTLLCLPRLCPRLLSKGNLIVGAGTSYFEGLVTANNGITISEGSLTIGAGDEEISEGDLTLTLG